MDMINDNSVKEIDLKNLFFKILRNWRSIIIVSILFFILVGGYKLGVGLKNLNNEAIIQSQENAYNDALKIYEVSKSSLTTEIENLKTSIERQETYNENSILMKINPFDKQEGTISFYVDTDYQIIPDFTYQNTDITKMILRSYTTLTQNGDMYNYIINNLSFKIELSYLKELLTSYAEYDTNMINVQVIYSDRKSCEEIIELIKKYFELAHNNINKIVGDHKLTIIENTIKTVVDYNVDTTQKLYIQNVTDYKNSLSEKEIALAALQAPTRVLTSNVNVVKSAIKYAIVGFILGMLLIVGVHLITILISDKILNEKELRIRFNLRILGRLTNNTRKNAFGFIDIGINRLEGITRILDENEEIKRISANLNAVLKLEGIQSCNIMFTGTANLEKIEALCRKLNDVLINDSYKLVSGGNINYIAKTIEQLETCEGVVIIEEIGRSSLTEIKNELENMKDLEKKVIGLVLL